VSFGIDVEVTGAVQLVRLAAAVKLYGDKELRKDMLRGLRAAAKPMAMSIKEEAAADLPHTGGLNEWVAKSSITPRTRTSGKSAGVRITGRKSGHDLEAINRGRVRHPVFGHNTWVSETVSSGWWERGALKQEDTVRRDLIVAMEEVAAKIARSA
jgi:hypothetical protein